MVFSSLNFLYLFLPLVLVLHSLLPARWKNPVLLAASLVFYAWGEPVYVGLMLLSILWNWLSGLQIAGRRSARGRRAALIGSIAVNVAILGYFKYRGFVVEMLNSALRLGLPERDLPLPIGISFYTFQAMSYVIDVYRQKAGVQRRIVDFALYITMFPQLVAGPIVQYSTIERQLAHRSVGRERMGQGVERFIQGLSKKVLLANNLGLIHAAVQGAASRSVLTAWLGAAAYAMQIYFDFSGYSDMAIGMGHMLGFSFPENFRDPYLADSVTDFWRRWHISLSSWFRDYVYIPLGGNRVGKARHILNLLIVWTLTGLWHGADWSFVLWGFYFAILLIAEKYLLQGLLAKMPMAARRLYTLLLVLISWVIFSTADLSQAGVWLGNMIGIGASSFADRTFLYLLRSNLVLLVIGVLCCTGKVRRAMVRQMFTQPAAAVAVSAALFLLSTAYLVYNSYNPFLYFRF